jgi:quercetin dioxygenase-like cupin family protein
MQQARSETSIDNGVVRVTTWTIGPGETTGPPRHELDYVVVPVRAGELVMAGADGATRTTMEPGTSYFRSAGVEHEVSNDGAATLVFVEVEIRR